MKVLQYYPVNLMYWLKPNKNILEGIEGISSIDKSEVKLQATDSNTINAKKFWYLY